MKYEIKILREKELFVDGSLHTVPMEKVSKKNVGGVAFYSGKKYRNIGAKVIIGTLKKKRKRIGAFEAIHAIKYDPNYFPVNLDDIEIDLSFLEEEEKELKVVIDLTNNDFTIISNRRRLQPLDVKRLTELYQNSKCIEIVYAGIGFIPESKSDYVRISRFIARPDYYQD